MWLINNTRTTVATTGFLRDIINRMDPEALNGLQVITDMHSTYKRSAVDLFNERGSFTQIRTIYADTADKGPERKYSPGVRVGSK